MGTNYYLVKNKPSTCGVVAHIGKNSFGWLFNFQTMKPCYDYPGIFWYTYPQVKEVLKRTTVDSTDYIIMNEYDEVVSYDDFVDLVDTKQSDEHCQSNPDNFKYSSNIDGYRFTDEDFC